jgi:predicted alpha-1,2-mannosidase
MMGTDSAHDFSNGNTLPLMARPWGTHHFAPVNGSQDAWFFNYRERAFAGLRLTHQPSPWMSDWCWATLMPQAGARRCSARERAQEVPSKALDLRPHRFSCDLSQEAIAWQAAPTEHGAAMAITWHQDGRRRVLIDTARIGDQPGAHQVQIRLDPARGAVVVRTAGGTGMHQDFALHLVLRCSVAAIGSGIFDAEGEREGQWEADGFALGCWLELPPGAGTVNLEMAGSFVDEEAAWALLEREVAGRNASVISAEAADAWDELLGRLELPESDERSKDLAATLCYRTLLFPRRLDEPGADGNPRHRCPDTGQVCAGGRVTDNGFWDTARSVYSWYSLLCPDHLPRILAGWLGGARSSGWLPSWASPGHRSCMTGSYVDAVFAEAVAKGIGGFDPAEALHYLRKHVEQPVADDAPYGRIALNDYLEHGYVPCERINKSVARTLDYAYGDWCIAGVAEAVGDQALAQACRKRAGNWRQVLCPETGFFRGRHADGSWLQPFDPYEWGGPYVEGSAWQFAWHVPHAGPELVAERGGADTAGAFLQRLLAEPPRFQPGSYRKTIHEMREMVAENHGQYAHSNQPSHFTLPYLAHCGLPDLCSEWVARVARDSYRLQPDGYCGDEDNGEMSAWWLCAALGLLPHCPGGDQWLVIRPLVPRAVIRVPGQRALAFGSGPSRVVGETAGHQAILAAGGLGKA